jgi:hypothetical protein
LSGGERTNRQVPPGREHEEAAELEEQPASGASEPCAFCKERPSGPLGHEGFKHQVYKIPSTDRSYVRLACLFCGAKWVRRRINAKTFEWLFLVG